MCPKRCHARVDHSGIPCGEVMNDICANGHELVWQCSDNRPPACQTCRLEKEERERKARRDKNLELERQAKQRAYAKQLAAVKDEIARQQQAMKDRLEERRREQTIRQHQAELARVTKQAQKSYNEKPPAPPQATAGSEPSPSTEASNNQESTPKEESQDDNTPAQVSADQPQPEKQETDNSADPDVADIGEAESVPARRPSSAESDWQQQKDLEFASNDALDSLMDMIGLETIKKEFLNIKARVDTAVRQGVDLKDNRLGAALLGNPGTGKGDWRLT